ncbi:MAG: hypothetical protein Q4E36_06605 [Bacillota bacterium]|nr:hypothetical protein [Bacillota bacterium]
MLVFAFSNLPLNLGFCLLGFSMMPDSLGPMVALEGASFYVFRKVFLSFLLPFLLTGFSLSLILGLYDFSIASVFAMNTFGLELLSRYSAGASLGEMFVLALPAILLTFGILGLIYPLFKSSFTTVNKGTSNPFSQTKAMKILAFFGGLILFIYLVLPILSLLWKALEARQVFSIIGNSLGELGTSFLLSILAASLIVLVGLLVAVQMKRPWQKFFGLSSLFLFIMPAALLALVAIRLMNRPLLGLVYDSIWMPILILFLRYQFIGILGLRLATSTLDQELFSLSHIWGLSSFNRLTLFAGLLKKELVAIFVLAFVFCTGDTTVPILVAPAGVQTISVKIYNYLHYGASDVIAVLCLVILAFCLIAIIFLQKLLGGGTSYERT